MGFLDDAGNLINRGVASAGRTTRSISLKSQISDLNKRRESLLAQLAANLYEEIRNDPRFRAPNEGIFFAVENIDSQIIALQFELANLEQQAQEQSTVQTGMIPCSVCGTQVSPHDTFCTGCGSKITPVQQPTKFCTGCGFAMGANDVFCTNCGLSVPAPVAEPAVESVVEPFVVPVTDPIVEPIVEPAAEPVIEQAAEPIMEQASEPAIKPVFEPVIEQAAEPTAEPVIEQAVSPTPEPAYIATAAPTYASAYVPTYAPAPEPVVAPEPAFAPTPEPAFTPAAEQPKFCTQCGFANAPAAVFCVNCGNKL